MTRDQDPTDTAQRFHTKEAFANVRVQEVLYTEGEYSPEEAFVG
jgi:hypothetical protein